MLLHMITFYQLFIVTAASAGNGSKMQTIFPSSTTFRKEVSIYELIILMKV